MKPTILFILHMPPPVHGAAMMGKYIHDSQVINNAFDSHYINLTTATDLSNIGKFSLKKIWSFLKLLHLIYRTVREFRPQLVYVTPNACGIAFYKDFIVVEMLKMMGCKVVVHYHNKGVSRRQDKMLDNFLYKIFFKKLKVILLSEKLYDDVKKYVKRENVQFCPNGIPDNSSTDSAKKTIKKNGVIHILFLSNLLESKGVIVLLDALKILKDKGYSIICNFAGGETNEIDSDRFHAEVSQRGLNNIAIYVGEKYGKAKDQAFDISDIFALPTYYECFPLVLLESMEHKLPIVSTDEGGIGDIVKNGENGLICEKKNPVSLANCIEALVTDSALREKMGNDGYVKFKQNYTIAAFETNFTQLIDDCYRGGR